MSSPDFAVMAASLAEVAVRNTASIVFTKVAAIRGRKNDREAVDLLNELINDLIADKAELVSIAQAFEQELVSQRISEQDVAYITNNVIPVVEKLANLADSDSGTQEAVDAIKSLVTVETVTIMQLVGFNFRRAVGEPLTVLVERLILSRAPASGTAQELRLLEARRELAYLEALQDPAARAALADPHG